MKCPMCGGIGLTDLHTPNVGRCIKCNGSGEIEQTNEEWFCSLPTKEKAKEMCVIMADMAEANDGVWDEEMIEEWLKEEHHE